MPSQVVWKYQIVHVEQFEREYLFVFALGLAHECLHDACFNVQMPQERTEINTKENITDNVM